MTNKLCPKCRQTKPAVDWARNKAKPDGLGSWCKACTNVLTKGWYRDPDNREKHKQLLYDRRESNKQRLIDYFGGVCLDCGTSYDPAVYDFHHLDPTQKDTNFGKINTCSWSKIEREIVGKCVMLCANCHRIRHAHRK